MSWNLVFWCGAFVVMCSIVTGLTVGVRAAKRRDIDRHLRAVRFVAGIVIGFVLAYAVKLIVLGREDRSAWTSLDLVTLYVHEFFIATMLAFGVVAAVRGRALLAGRAERSDDWMRARRRHAIAGRICYGAAWLALLTGGAVLARMFVRAP